MAKKKIETEEISLGSFVAPLQESITGLQGEIAALELKLEGVDEVYAQLRLKKKQAHVLERTMAQLSGAPSSPNRPRGQNLVDITAWLTENPTDATVREISESTGINIPSVRYTLSRNSQFQKTSGNCWTV